MCCKDIHEQPIPTPSLPHLVSLDHSGHSKAVIDIRLNRISCDIDCGMVIYETKEKHSEKLKAILPLVRGRIVNNNSPRIAGP